MFRGSSVSNSISSFLLSQLARGDLYASLYDDIQMTRHVCKFFASPIHSFTTLGKFVFFWVYMNLLILYSHMDLFAIPHSERGGSLHYSFYCMGTTLLNQAQGVNWGCSL